MVIEELHEHYKAVVRGEPEYHDLHTWSGKTIGVFEWPKSRFGVHLYASAGASNHEPGQGATQSSFSSA
ncbi:hypothetical protein [Arthrobacter sp. ok362]|uniref:hypothetical protein n=1 Tax=Arthrobacter sp. ok362 TaxID=1761745 RepID=UPI00088B523A|nr:hypothetical protein [Arthrobacter sp. ok362]SDL53757.1 hypothetical protein SAMN04487913_110176 [Arthrobacter sp. ok362]